MNRILGEELAGKVAIVTGGARGMGRATVELFAAEGARVVIADILDDAGNELASALGQNVAYCHTDVSHASEVEALVAFTVERFGRLDVMFNNAGVVLRPQSIDLLDDDFSIVEREFAVNLLGPMYGVKYAGRQMARTGGGSIINTASTTASAPGLNILSYRISKAGVVSLTQNAAIALGKYGIRVNAISPGPIATPILTDGLGLSPEKADAVMKAVFGDMLTIQPLKRLGQPEDIAQAALFLASGRSAQVTGINLTVSGGEGLGDLVDHTARVAEIMRRVMCDET